MAEKLTTNQLKQALVRVLPEKIENYPLTNSPKWIAKSSSKTGYLVTDYEWPAIVGMVFHKWKKEQTTDFKRQYFLPDAPWQEMAEYLVDIGAISVLLPT